MERATLALRGQQQSDDREHDQDCYDDHKNPLVTWRGLPPLSNSFRAPRCGDPLKTAIETAGKGNCKRYRFRAEFFNVLNHSDFLLPNWQVVGFAPVPLPTAGIISGTPLNNQREIQLTMRVEF